MHLKLQIPFGFGKAFFQDLETFSEIYVQYKFSLRCCFNINFEHTIARVSLVQVSDAFAVFIAQKIVLPIIQLHSLF